MWLERMQLGRPGIEAAGAGCEFCLFRPQQQALACQSFSPIFLVHRQHLLSEQVLPESLHVIEAVSQELEQRPPLLLTALWAHRPAQATDTPGTQVPYWRYQVQALGRSGKERLSLEPPMSVRVGSPCSWSMKLSPATLLPTAASWPTKFSFQNFQILLLRSPKFSHVFP